MDSFNYFSQQTALSVQCDIFGLCELGFNFPSGDWSDTADIEEDETPVTLRTQDLSYFVFLGLGLNILDILESSAGSL